MNSLVVTLLIKDLRRLRANWVGFVVLLAMPMCITALIGIVFGPSARKNEVPRVRIAIVDEDKNVISNLVAGGLANEQTSQYLEAISTDRKTALQLINDNEVSAILIFPEGFSDQYLAGNATPDLQLIKNPAQSFMPAITEELTGVLTEILNAVSLNLSAELPEIAKVFEDNAGVPDMRRLGKVMNRLGDKFERAEGYLFPPAIGYTESSIEPASEKTQESPSEFNVFAFVMPGLVAMFLLFVADTAVRDLVVERRVRTLMRFRTLRSGLLTFFVAKSAYAFVVTVIAAAIMLIGGAFVFGIQWVDPLAVVVLAVSYSLFSVGFAFLIIGMVYRERLISILSTVVVMLIAFLGGSMLPTNSLPPMVRNSIAPWMPNYLFAESIKNVQFDVNGPNWLVASATLSLIGVIMLLVAVKLFHRRMLQGARE